MAATSASLIAQGMGGAQAVSVSSAPRRRYITAEAGHALEILGHAIEYLADEYVHEGKQLSANDPQVAAIQLLMAINREIYFACPVAPTFRERLCAFFHVAAQ